MLPVLNLSGVVEAGITYESLPEHRRQLALVLLTDVSISYRRWAHLTDVGASYRCAGNISRFFADEALTESSGRV
jgi:hypothetical protein